MPDYLPTLAPLPLATGIPGVEERARRARIAEALLKEGHSTEPIQSWTQGAARVAQALLGGYQLGQVGREAQAERDRRAAAIGGVFDQYRDQGAGMPSAAIPQRQAETAPPAAAAAAVDPATLPTHSFAERFAGEPPQMAAAPAPVRMASALPIEAIKKFEGYSPTAYADYKQHSVGYGTRATSPNERITPDVAEARLSDEVGKAATIVDKFKPDLPPGVRDALVSLTYNAGDSWTRSGLGQAVQKGDYGAAQQIFQQYNRAGGQVLPGLVSRRQQEAQWFDRGAPAGAQAPIAPAARGIDQRTLATLRGLATSGDPQLEKYALERLSEYTKPAEPQLKEITLPNGDKVTVWADPRTGRLALPQIPGGGGATGTPTTVEGPKGPVDIPQNLNAKEREAYIKNVLSNTADVRSGKLTESQSKDAIFAGRMLGSTRQLTPDIEAEGLSLAGKAMSKAPYDLGKYAQNEKRQMYDSLQFQWISGALRKESGAAIQPFEWDRYERTFFPQPGEGPKVIEMKRQARAVADDLMQKGVPVDIEAEVRKRMPELSPTVGSGGPQGGGDPLAEARDAIGRGADRAKVIERLRQRGINPAGL